MINIKTKNEKIKMMIERVLKLIEKEEIVNINADIIILESNIEYLKYFYNIRNFIENVYFMYRDDKMYAFSCVYYDKLFILSHRFNLNNDLDIGNMIATVIHEMQHQYQRQKTPWWYSMAKRYEYTEKLSLIHYKDLPLEKDADEVTRELMTKYSSEFYDIVREVFDNE